MAPVFVAEGDVAGDVITHVTPVKDVRSGILARNIREASPPHSELATVEEEDYVFIHKIKDGDSLYTVSSDTSSSTGHSKCWATGHHRQTGV